MYDFAGDMVQEEQVRKIPRGFWPLENGTYIRLGNGEHFAALPQGRMHDAWYNGASALLGDPSLVRNKC